MDAHLVNDTNQQLCRAVLEDASQHFTAFGAFLNELRSLPWVVQAAEYGGFYTLGLTCPSSTYAIFISQPGMEETDLPPTVEAYYLMIWDMQSGDEVLHLMRQGAERDVAYDGLTDHLNSTRTGT